MENKTFVHFTKIFSGLENQHILDDFYTADIPDSLRIEIIKTACLLMTAPGYGKLSLAVATAVIFEHFSRRDKVDLKPQPLKVEVGPNGIGIL